jgi:hypothetical protein
MLLLALLAGVGLVPPSATALEGSTEPGIVVYGACERNQSATPSHRCHKGQKLGAFFQSNGVDALYSVCVQFPNRRQICAEDQRAAKGVLYVNSITDGMLGTVQIDWYVDSVAVGHWTLELVPAAIVPRFGVKALVVSGTRRLAGFMVGHVPAGLRVRAWRGCGATCPLRLRLASRRGAARRYLIAGPDRRYRFRPGAVLYVQVDDPGGFEHGDPVWGRLFIGKLVSGGRRSRDTAFRRVGPLLCVPPGGAFEAATSCGASATP